MQPCPQDTTPSITSMAPPTARGVSTTKDADNTSNDAPTWDTSPNTFPQYQELMVWLPKQESRYTLLVQQFVALDRTYTCCVSDNHSQRIDMGLLTKGSFRNPTLIKPNDTLIVPPICVCWCVLNELRRRGACNVVRSQGARCASSHLLGRCLRSAEACCMSGFAMRARVLWDGRWAVSLLASRKPIHDCPAKFAVPECVC